MTAKLFSFSSWIMSICLAALPLVQEDTEITMLTISSEYTYGSLKCEDPIPMFSLAANSRTVSFTDGSMNSPTSWLWDFGDGNTSTQQNPQHTYLVDGTYTVCLTVINSCGQDSTCKSVLVCAIADPSFTYSVADRKVSFTDGSMNSPTFWLWDFGDGNTSTQQNPQHTYQAYGTYTVCLTVLNACGADSTCKSVVVCAIADPSFSFSVSDRDVSFTDGSMNSPTFWLWDFGDGNTSTQQSPQHTYQAYGTYTVCLTVLNACGADSTCKSVVVCAIADPSFSFSASNREVSFTDESMNGPTFWLWDFGDGNTSTQQNPQHTYPSDGTYTVCLTVSNACGVDSMCKSVVVCAIADPSFSFSVSDRDVRFTDESMNSPTSWLWDFGDGNTSTQQNPQHTYQAYGTYTVCLTVLNACGADSTCKSVVVCAIADPSFSFSVSDRNVSFTDGSINSPTSWLWDFGDGNTSTQQNPQHTYPADGTYTVCLTVSNVCGIDSICMNVIICLKPQAGYSFEVDGPTVSFFDNTDLIPDFWFWDFDDGSDSPMANPVHKYMDIDDYTVCLTVGNNCGMDTTCQVVRPAEDIFGVCCPDTLLLSEALIIPGAYTASNTIEAVGEIQDSVSFKAPINILLKSTFEVKIGSSFEIVIEPCQE